MPTTYLTAQMIKGGKQGFVGDVQPKTPLDKTGQTTLLAKGRVGMAMVLNHGCDIDKPQTRRLQCALVARLDLLPEKDRVSVAAGQSKAMLYLPDLPGVGDCFADFRYCVTVERGAVEAASRLASMTEAGRLRVQAQLMTYYTRRDFTD